MIGKIFWLLLAIFFGMLISGIAMPFIWFIIRLLGLIEPLINLFGGIRGVIYTGGVAFGTVIGAASIIIILKVFGEWNKLGIMFGVIGGIIGGVASSVMFFPLVAIL
jgi:hypothetical protein